MPGVYISYPFCAQKCTYCNFASGVFSRDLEHRYHAAIESEIGAHAWNWRPNTVYLGGGTPSQMPVEALRKLLSLIPGRPWSEATMEAAPGTITDEKARTWFDCGINRVSLGVQSFVQRELARTGRKHTAAVVEHEIEVLRRCGISNINIDLIAGLPGQTLESWRQSLDWVGRLSPPHVSVYMLEVDEDSRLGKEVLFNGKRYGAPEVPSDALIVEMYEAALKSLHEIGVARYEISNFARPGFESLHNLKYWKLQPYIGFGSDAHSFDCGVRYQNVESAADYVARWEKRESPRAACVEANPVEEKFFVGLRLSQGVRPDSAEWRLYGDVIDRFIGDGLLEQDDGAVRLTERGVLVSNDVFQEFIHCG